MKQVVIVLTMIITVVLAIDYVNKIRLHTKALNQCGLLIDNIEMLLSYNNLSVAEIFRVLSDNNSYYLLSFISSIYNNMQKNIDSYILNDENILCIKNNKYLNNDDKEILINFLSLLGISDLNSQISNCKAFKEIFRKKIKENEKRELSDCKSSGVLIVGIGFLVVIMMI